MKVLTIQALNLLILIACWSTASSFEQSATHLLSYLQTRPHFVVAPLKSHSIERPSCFYRSRTSGTWKERLELSDLQLGQELDDCCVVEELLDGKTGPKIFCDCGVGRLRPNNNGTWKIVHAMLRLDRKESAARKRAARLRKKKSFPVYVSRIRLENDQFEVCLSPGDVKTTLEKKISVSQLKEGQEVVGTVVRLRPYGAFVDVGANRCGLLHIQKVADLSGRYIDKVKGLTEAGLERGARVRLQVASNQKRRLFLDFTADVKAEAASEGKPRKIHQQPTGSASLSQTRQQTVVLSTAEETARASFNADRSANVAEDDDDYDDDEDDDYDEDREIEDALGLGTY